METNAIYFERNVTHDNKKLILASELRRKVVQAIKQDKNAYETCLKYYNELCNIAVEETRLKRNMLFIWNGHNSSCWNFEKLHILQLLSHWSHDKAVDKQPTEAKKWFSKAVRYELESIKVLNTYLWKDPTISGLPIMQQRYHLAKGLIYASDYYYNMYTFKEMLAPVKKSYQLMELASRLWKKLDFSQMNARHALALKHIAKDLPDDDCGAKVALMKKALSLHDVKEMEELYNLWKQQNDSVYYNAVETDITISHLSVEDSLQALLNIA